MSDLLTIAEATVLHLTIRPGRTFRHVLWVMEDDAATPIPLDGWDGKAEIRDDDNRLLLTFDIEVSQETEISEDTCGRVVMSATAEDTRAVRRDGFYDLTLTRGADETFETRVLTKGEVVREEMATVVGE